MKPILFALLLVDPYSLAVQGGSQFINAASDKWLIDWSVGQAIDTHTLTNNNAFIISAGFLQNKNCDRCLYKNLDAFLNNLKWGPNPVQDYLHIQINQAGLLWTNIEIYTIEGRLIQSTRPNLYGMQLDYTMDWRSFQEGTYFLKVYFLIDEQFPISKTIQIHKT